VNLPDNVADIELLRINRNMRKICSCEKKSFEVDTKNRSVWCKKCGAWVDPFDAMMYLAENLEDYKREAQMFLNRAKDYYNYKPHLRIMKSIEQHYKANNYSMVPTCPECNKPFELEKLTSTIWVNKHYIRKDDDK
jgi:Zn finger protein HypA/HybF involved in hydrogenase expression